MDELPLTDPRVIYAISFPRPLISCSKRINELKSMGIDSILSCGRTRLWTPFGEIKILGKGHAGIVLLSRYGREIIAIKIRRSDSKRKSLREEAHYQDICALAGIAPKVVDFSDDFILSEVIKGPLLLDLVKGETLNYNHLIESIESLAILDKMNILHEEIHRPLKNIIFSDSKALIIDYDSAKRGCGNLSKFTSWLFKFLKIDKKLTEPVLFEELRKYKRLCHRRIDYIKDLLNGIVLDIKEQSL